MNIALSLSGGAVRGAFHLGVLQAFDDLHVNIKALSGSSIGALIAASYASGVSPKEQLELFKSKDFMDSIEFNYFKNGIYKINENHKIYDALLPCGAFEELCIPVHINCVDLNEGVLHVFNSGPLKPACLGSTALTPLFRPIEHEEMLLADGGFVDNFPVKPLKRYKLPIVGVNAMPVTVKKPKGIFKITKRSLFMLTQSHVINQIDNCDLYITSEQLAGYPLFKRDNIDELFALGYEIGMRKASDFISP
ncbi:MAG: patatin-like phospholipase family protein [Campylobacterota bacterium]|nr:patatin-like phospholipase family protein [Campylobacterota bacterium]